MSRWRSRGGNKNGRREFHSKEFLADEAQFEHYEEARVWERRHLDALLTY